MPKIHKIRVASGMFLVDIPDAELHIQCGCPADSVKHLMKRGLIVTKEQNGVVYETGPNAVLLSDVLVQNGTFANLAEFPVLQMLYKQGMIIPKHPNNTGLKPILIGMREQVEAQMEYIYRGNYGLVTEAEILETGVDPEFVREIMRLKLKFAFGRIRPAEDLLESRFVSREPVEIRNGVTVRRLRLNVFEIAYKDETTVVDLNLLPHEFYGAPYPLGFHLIRREYFAVIHSGEGDGWNVNHPCMSSILMFQGRIYLIDAGPNVLFSLMALGIGINEIEGIFHTHAHDDHFAGFTTLMQADHRIKYYATPLVRRSVAMKLASLMSIDERNLTDYFEVHDLKFDVWNDIDGLEVKPIFSPHPVETSVLIFRTLWADGYRSYAHFADIVSLSVLKGMITDDPNQNGVSRAFYERVKREYAVNVDIKKIDVGGGLIHGDAEDFKDDPADKIILSHISIDLTNRQKEIGSGAPFGMVDTMIPSDRNYLYTDAFKYLKSYFPGAPDHQLNILLNNELVIFNPESILIRRGEVNDAVFLVLTGNVEMIQSEIGVHSFLSAGALTGEISALDRIPSGFTYRAANFVQAMRLPWTLYTTFVKKNRLYDNIKQLQDNRDFLQRTWLFGEVVSYLTQNRIAQAITYEGFSAGQTVDRTDCADIFLIRSGKMERFDGDTVYEEIGPGQFFGEECVFYGRECHMNETDLCRFRCLEDTEVFKISSAVLLDIPVVRWKLYETFQRRMKMRLRSSLAEDTAM